MFSQNISCTNSWRDMVLWSEPNLFIFDRAYSSLGDPCRNDFSKRTTLKQSWLQKQRNKDGELAWIYPQVYPVKVEDRSIMAKSACFLLREPGFQGRS